METQAHMQLPQNTVGTHTNSTCGHLPMYRWSSLGSSSTCQEMQRRNGTMQEAASQGKGCDWLIFIRLPSFAPRGVKGVKEGGAGRL